MCFLYLKVKKRILKKNNIFKFYKMKIINSYFKLIYKLKVRTRKRERERERERERKERERNIYEISFLIGLFLNKKKFLD